jgi:cell wall-associated NlpC family hydrolase
VRRTLTRLAAMTVSLLAVTASSALSAQAASPAADGLLGPNLSIGLGSTPASSGLPAGVAGIGSALDLVTSGYGLSAVDPLTGTMSMGAIALAVDPAAAITADLAAQDMLAIDAADLARRARMEEDARRRAAAQGASGGGLKAGTVPEEYRQLILDAVADHCPALAPSVLAAQLEAESNFNPRATSSAGAQGIAQFMPATWSTYGIDGDGDGRRDVWDPADAIPAAAAYDCHLLDLVHDVPGDPTANMLAAYNAGPGNVRKYGGVPPFDETRTYVAKITARADTMRDDADTINGPGNAGGPDGCPTSAPSGTLRAGSAGIGIAKLCADSVADARTPYAARAIKFALRNLGAPYSQPQRMASFRYDCSSFVMRAYDSAGLNVVNGWAPNTTAIRAADWAVKIPHSSRRPGDLEFPYPGHVAMTLADGYKVHTNRTGDVSHVTDDYTSAYWTVRIDPSRV